MSTTSVLTFPLYLWDLYVGYLWNYEHESWVDRTASTFRVMAFLLLTPFAILTMLDVASYVIARTLGVIDATKASTSGVPAHEQSTHADGVPSIHVSLSSPAAGELLTTETETETEAEHETEPGAGAGTRAGAAPSASSDSLSFFRDTLVEEGNPRLAGIDAFSPAPSQPSSPTLSRKDLAVHGHHQLGSGFGLGLAPLETREEEGEDEEASSAGSSRFTMIDGESGSDESAEGVLVRRRTRRVDEDAS